MKQEHFPAVEVLDLGGGLGVVQNPTQGPALLSYCPNGRDCKCSMECCLGDIPLPMEVVHDTLAKFKQDHTDVSLWMEPGTARNGDRSIFLI